MGAILGAATPAQAAAPPATAPASVHDQIRQAFTAGALAPAAQGRPAVICDPL